MSAHRPILVFALGALVAVGGLWAVVFVPAAFAPVPFSYQDFRAWLVKEEFFYVTSLVTSFTAGVLTVLAAWPRHRIWALLVVLGLLVDAYSGVVLNAIGHTIIFPFTSDIADWLELVIGPAVPAVLALLYAVRLGPRGAGPHPLAAQAPTDTDAALSELHYSSLRTGELDV